MLSFFKKEKKDKVLVRVYIGCILPHNAILIGQGTYPFIGVKGKTTEQYYDYEISEEDLVHFLELNSTLLIKYQLLDVETEEKPEDKNPVKPTTIRGWVKKD